MKVIITLEVPLDSELEYSFIEELMIDLKHLERAYPEGSQFIIDDVIED
jgi:hypothetical protein